MELMESEYCQAWSQEVKDAERRRFRAECKLRCLEANLDRITPVEFDGLMDQIEAAQEELRTAGLNLIRIRTHAAQKEAAQRDTH